MLAQLEQIDITLWLSSGGIFFSLLLLLLVFKQKRHIAELSQQQTTLNSQLSQLVPLLQTLPVEIKMSTEQQLADLRMKLMRQQADFHQQTNAQQLKSFDTLHQTLARNGKENREELANTLAKNIASLTETTDNRLQNISEQVEKRLSDGFEKTTKTFNDILKRLALIDDAQQKITELSTNVVSLQEVLADKRSRGAFGEVQLNALIKNVLPESHFAIQHTLSNGKIADCVLFLPQPTGNVVVDAKFPLESYRTFTDITLAESDRKAAQRQFKQDIKKHINDISSKYLIEHETAEGAVMFIPAEAVFAEIHAHHSDLVELANKKRVWLASPTTLMAILTTARAVIKDEATKEQVHIIQAHLGHLSSDFARFRTRFDNLAKHIDQAASDVKQINTSANKIANRFEKIEQVDTSLTDSNLSEISSNN